MEQHAGAGCILSVFIVIAFTLVFHETEPPEPVEPAPPIAQASAPGPSPADPAAARASAPVVAAADRQPAPPTRRPAPIEPIAPQPLAEVLPSPPLTAARGERPTAVPIATRPAEPPARNLVSLAPLAPTPAAAGATPPASVGAGPAVGVRAARSSATVIERGERLVDVAIRVYGSAEAAAKLWRANRDRLTSVEAPVAEGLLLRTP